MIVAETVPFAQGSRAGQSLPARLRRWARRLVPLLSAPVFCLGLTLLGLAPLLLE